MDLLDLPNYEILDHQQTTFELRLTIKHRHVPTVCPKCGTVGAKITRNGTKKQIYNDLPIRAKRVGLQIIRQKYECHDCQDWFFEELPDMHESRRMTQRLYTYIREQAVLKTFTSLAREVGVDEKLVRDIFDEYTEELKKNAKPLITPNWMGIDELTLLHKPRCIITNVKERVIVDLLKDRYQATVINWLLKLPDRDKIKYVTMDMWPPYRRAVERVLPKAKIIVDKFHVLDKLSDVIDDVRVSIHKDLPAKQRRTLKHDSYIFKTRKHRLKPEKLIIMESWTNTFPMLSKAYDLKEQFYDIYDLAMDSKQAGKLYDKWKASIPPELKPHLKPFLTLMKNWSVYIFNYFDADKKITNAYTEALNGTIKARNREGRGYSFKVARAKAIYNGDIEKVEVQSFRSAWPEPEPENRPDDRYVYSEIHHLTQLCTYGVDMAAAIIILQGEEAATHFHQIPGRSNRQKPADS